MDGGIMNSKMTVMINIVDREKAKPIIDALYTAMRSDEAVYGIRVSAMSVGDEFSRLELLESAHESGREDLFDEIFSMRDPDSVSSIAKLDGY